MCGDLTGNELEEGMTVIIQGTVLSVDAPLEGRCTVVVEVSKKGVATELSFFSEDLIKATSGQQISGALTEPTAP